MRSPAGPAVIGIVTGLPGVAGQWEGWDAVFGAAVGTGVDAATAGAVLRIGSQASLGVVHASAASQAAEANEMSWTSNVGPPVEYSASTAMKHCSERQSLDPSAVVSTA